MNWEEEQALVGGTAIAVFPLLSSPPVQLRATVACQIAVQTLMDSEREGNEGEGVKKGTGGAVIYTSEWRDHLQAWKAFVPAQFPFVQIIIIQIIIFFIYK